MRSWLGIVVMGGAGLLGCTGGGAAEGGPALVMLDPEARAAGFALVTAEGKIAPVTPVEVEGDVTLIGPGQRIPLTVAAGELLVVTGKRGALVPRALATEVDADAVRVTGAEPSVRAFASALRAKVSGSGPWELRAPGLVASLAHRTPPEGISAIESIDVEAAQAAQIVAAAEEARPFSSSDPRFASFVALGARSPVCSDPSVGTWVSVPQLFEHWHAFTLHVAPGGRPGELSGTVNAHVWSGGADEPAPAACDDQELDVQVSMPATGVRAEDGSLRFDAGRWQIDRAASCTGTDEGWGYLPDHFSGVAEGGAFRTVNKDGSRFSNAPVPFERVSCE